MDAVAISLALLQDAQTEPDLKSLARAYVRRAASRFLKNIGPGRGAGDRLRMVHRDGSLDPPSLWRDQFGMRQPDHGYRPQLCA